MRARTRNARTHAIYVHKNQFCKVHFAKIRKFSLFIYIACIYQKKAVPLHRD